MPRQGITYKQFCEAAETLLQNEKRVTVRNVREVLKCGSHETINKHLKAWKEKESGRCELQAPDFVETILKEAGQAIFSKLHTVFNDDVDAIRIGTREKLSECHQIINDYDQKCQILIKENSNLYSSVETLEKLMEEDRAKASYVRLSQ